MAGLDPVTGSEQGGFRPVVIVQNDKGNLHAPTVIAVPITASTRKPALPTHASIPAGTTTLVCAVFADAGDAAPAAIPEEVLNIAQSC